MNQNYDQLADLIAQDKFSWERDTINAMLYTGLEFDGADKTVADLDGGFRSLQRIDGRFVSDRAAYGLPVAYSRAEGGIQYQIVLAQDTGLNNPNLIAFIDVNADDSPLQVQHTGTMIVRPVLPEEEIPGHTGSNVGVWMRLPI